MSPETVNDLFTYLTQLMTEHAGLFETIGLHMFKAFAIIIIAWFGITSALASASGEGGFRFDRFARLLMTVAFGLGMVTYYTHPIPGVGMSFYKLVTDQGFDLANQLNHGMVQTVTERLNTIYIGLEQPGALLAFNLIEAIRYGVIVLCIGAAEIAMFVVIAFGYIAMSIAVLLGPIFLPFFIVPQMEWLFWGWLKSLLQYSFYPVIANAYIYIFGHLLMRFTDAHPAPYDGANVLVLFLPFFVMLVAFTYGILKIPSLVNSLFTGSAGQSALPLGLLH